MTPGSTLVCRRLATLLALWLACAWAPLRAATADAAPPARVGQLAFIGGTVRSFLEGGSEWELADLNMPVTARLSLATDKGSRAEVRIGSAAVRLDGNAQAEFYELDDQALSCELARGSTALRLRSLAAGERVVLSADGARFTPVGPGAYRAEFDPKSHRFTVHVISGSASLSVGERVVMLSAGQQAVADTRSRTVLEQSLGERNRFDDWAEQRDKRFDRSAALRVLPAEMTGAEALDGHGAWRNEPAYGPVWYPDIPDPDWAPYRNGRWRWVAPWGWTWVDAAPWGFAPFHYGRWIFLAGRWGWAPGGPGNAALRWQPVYAPALVGFYGSSGWQASATASPLVGWYPLAPGEVYWPAYTQQIVYVRSLNAASVVGAAQINALPAAGSALPAHRFSRTSFAATAMPQEAWAAQQPVSQALVALPPSALAAAPLAGARWAPTLMVAPAPAPNPSPATAPTQASTAAVAPVPADAYAPRPAAVQRSASANANASPFKHPVAPERPARRPHPQQPPQGPHHKAV